MRIAHNENLKHEFITSLRFLTDEAERSGLDELTVVLQTALSMARGDRTQLERQLLESLDDPDNDDMRLVICFLLRFLTSNEAVQHKVIEAIEQNEL